MFNLLLLVSGRAARRSAGRVGLCLTNGAEPAPFRPLTPVKPLNAPPCGALAHERRKE
jgi:hypothetical protein